MHGLDEKTKETFADLGINAADARFDLDMWSGWSRTPKAKLKPIAARLIHAGLLQKAEPGYYLMAGEFCARADALRT